MTKIAKSTFYNARIPVGSYNFQLGCPPVAYLKNGTAYD